MAENAVPKAVPSNGPPADIGPEAPESLDQVRDILFGGQMRMVDARLRGLEERFLHEQSALRSEFTRLLADMDGSTKKELANQTDQLAAERAKRADDLKALGAEFKEALKSLDRRHQQLEAAAGLADAELRDQLLKATAAHAAELARTAQRISTELDRSTAALRNEKLDTSALATALTEMASKLTGNGSAPVKVRPRD